MPKLSSIISTASIVIALACIVFGILMGKQKTLLEAAIATTRQSIHSAEQARDEALAHTGQVERDHAELQAVLSAERNRVANLQQQSDRARREVLRLEQMHDESTRQLDEADHENRKLKRDLIAAKSKPRNTPDPDEIADYEAKIYALKARLAEFLDGTAAESTPHSDQQINGRDAFGESIRPVAPRGTRQDATVLATSPDGSVVAFSLGSNHGMAAKMRVSMNDVHGESTRAEIAIVRPEFCIANVLPGRKHSHRLKKSETFVIIVQ